MAGPADSSNGTPDWPGCFGSGNRPAGKPVAVTELLERFPNNPEAVLTALGSLIQRGLVLLM